MDNFTLHDCIEFQDFDCVKNLLAMGASVDEAGQFEKEFTAIFHAIDTSVHSGDSSASETRIIKLLLQNGCNLSLRYRDMTPLDFAKHLGHLSAVSLISDEIAGRESVKVPRKSGSS